MKCLESWLANPDPNDFPFREVTRRIQLTGKHFIPPDDMGKYRKALQLNSARELTQDHQVLHKYLSSVCDKDLGKFNYQSYIAIPLLNLPDLEDPIGQASFAAPRCDRLTLALTADLLGFELDTAANKSTPLPKSRPEVDLTAKRIRLVLRAMTPALERTGFCQTKSDKIGARTGDRIRQAVNKELSMRESRAVDISLLPVYVVHDEYLFLRVLQVCETFFGFMGSQLKAAVHFLSEGDMRQGIHFLYRCQRAFIEIRPYFSLVATMRVESFHEFRQFTEGASAIQSENFKLVESLLSKPNSDGLNSSAYQKVPRVKQRARSNRQTINSVANRLLNSDAYDTVLIQELEVAVALVCESLTRWRKTHYRLAMRLLGTEPGTGNTEGTSYLARSLESSASSGSLTPRLRAGAE